MVLLAVVAWQELRWQLHAPFMLTGVSHAVGVPAGEQLTSGYTLQNLSRLPLTIERVDVLGDRHRRTDAETARLDATRIVAVQGDRPIPAKRGGALERGLTSYDPEGRTVPAGGTLNLAVTFVGTAADEYRAGPVQLAYRFGPWQREQEVPLGRAYRIRVTGPDPTPRPPTTSSQGNQP